MLFEQRRRVLLLRGHVHRLIVVGGIGDDGQVEGAGVGRREARVAIVRPLHRRAHAVAVAEIDVVAHADLVAVVDDRLPGSVSSRQFSSSMRRRSLSISGASRRRIPRFSFIDGSEAYA